MQQAQHGLQHPDQGAAGGALGGFTTARKEVVELLRQQGYAATGVQQIATAAEEQHQVAEDINRHISQIHGDAQLVAELAQAARQDSESLAGLSNELDSLVRRFRT